MDFQINEKQYAKISFALKRIENSICEENGASINFIFSILYDLISNFLAVIVNNQYQNINSPGVDLSCRIVNEASSILKMDLRHKKLDERQKNIQTDFYWTSEYNNYKPFWDILKENSDYNLLKQRVEAAKQSISNYYDKNGRKTEDNLFINDPSSFMKKSKDDNTRYENIVLNYSLLGQQTLDAYRYFSIFVHPNNIKDEYKRELLSYRENYIDELLKIVNLVFIEPFEIINDSNDFEINNCAKDTIQKFIQPLDDIMNQLYDYLHSHEFTNECWFILKAKEIIKEMLISFFNNLKAHTIALFKVLLEFCGVSFAIGSKNYLFSQDNFNIVCKGFQASTDIMFDGFFKRCGIKKHFSSEKEIQDIYNSFYKKKYKVDYRTFRHELSMNRLYFLSNGKKSYSKYAHMIINKFGEDEDEIKLLLFLNNISLDMSHSSGYILNGGVDRTKSLSEQVIIKSLLLVLYFIEQQWPHTDTVDNETLYNNAINGINSIIDNFETLIEKNEKI